METYPLQTTCLSPFLAPNLQKQTHVSNAPDRYTASQPQSPKPQVFKVEELRLGVFAFRADLELPPFFCRVSKILYHVYKKNPNKSR